MGGLSAKKMVAADLECTGLQPLGKAGRRATDNVHMLLGVSWGPTALGAQGMLGYSEFGVSCGAVGWATGLLGVVRWLANPYSSTNWDAPFWAGGARAGLVLDVGLAVWAVGLDVRPRNPRASSVCVCGRGGSTQGPWYH